MYKLGQIINATCVAKVTHADGKIEYRKSVKKVTVTQKILDYFKKRKGDK